MNDDYIEKFLDQDDLQKSQGPTMPSWVSDNNSSKAAYLAIQTLYKIKLDYIRKHSKKEHFKLKSSYYISKSEVARMISKTPNAIFNTVDYKVPLTDEWKDKNDKLVASYEKSIFKNRKGKQGYTKQKLVQVLQKTEQELQVISEKTVEEVLERSINRLPMPIRRQLGLS